MKHLLTIVASLALAACAAGPDFKPPVNAPGTLVNARSSALAPLEPRSPEGVWWQQFDDPMLNDLMGRALESNLDIKLAGDRVRAAHAVFSGSEYDYAPHVPLTAGYAGAREQEPGFGSQRINAESYSAGLDVAWELDLFGHVRRTVEAARGDLAAEREDLEYARIAVAAEVARNYFSLRSTQQQIKVAHDNLENQRAAVHLTSLRYESGRGTELDVQSSRARLAATEALLPQLETAQAAELYRLAVLLGQRPGTLDSQLQPQAVPVYAKALPIGKDGEDVGILMRNRPDVCEAEQRLAAATARTGIATADLFPRVTVTGFVGFLSGDFSHLFSSSSGTDARAWSIAPSVSWAALDYGSVHARLRASRANADGALVSYEKTVLNALEETENAFVNYREQQARLKSLIEQAEASHRAADLAAVQYREGVTDFLTLLDAQRTQLAAESAVAETEGAVNAGVVAIYKALGGVAPSPAGPTVPPSETS